MKKRVPKPISDYYRELAKKSVKVRHKKLLEGLKTYPQEGDNKGLTTNERGV